MLLTCESMLSTSSQLYGLCLTSLAWGAGKNMLDPLRRGCVCFHPEGGSPIWHCWGSRSSAAVSSNAPVADPSLSRRLPSTIGMR